MSSISKWMPTSSCIWRQWIVTGYNLRNNENYVLPRCRLRISEKSFIPSTVRIWNDLSPTIRNLQTISQFKLKIKGEQFRPRYTMVKDLENLTYCIQGYDINVVL